MAEIPDILGNINPERNRITGDAAINMAANILDNYDLSAYTPQDILSALHQSNISINVPDFYSTYETITGQKVRSQRVKYVNLDKIPSEAILEPARYQLPTRYRIVHYITYEDNETGAIISREFITDTDSLQSIAYMQQNAIDQFESKYPVTVSQISTVRGYKNTGV